MAPLGSAWKDPKSREFSGWAGVFEFHYIVVFLTKIFSSDSVGLSNQFACFFGTCRLGCWVLKRFKILQLAKKLGLPPCVSPSQSRTRSARWIHLAESLGDTLDERSIVGWKDTPNQLLWDVKMRSRCFAFKTRSAQIFSCMAPYNKFVVLLPILMPLS